MYWGDIGEHEQHLNFDISKFLSQEVIIYTPIVFNSACFPLDTMNYQKIQ